MDAPVSKATRLSDITDRLADHVLAHGLTASSLRPLAAAAGLSDRMLLYHFADKDAVIAAALARLGERLTAQMAAMAAAPLPLAELRPRLLALLLADDIWPYMCLWLELATMAARGNPMARAMGENLGRGFHAWGAAQLASDTPERDAAELLISIEGAMLLKSLGLSDVTAQAFP